MGQNFIGCDRDQVLLLPPDLREWLPESHLARFVIETVEQLDLSGIYGYYRQDGRGRPAHDPAMMVALLLYAYAVGVTSSREVERKCVDDVAFRVISANERPDHSTIARFLVRHRDQVQDLFLQVLALCRRAGMVSAGTVAVDSTKLAANASASQNRTLEALEAEAARVIDEAVETDRREDQLYGDRRGDELPDDLADPRTRKARIRELLEQARLEREHAEAEVKQRVAEHREHFERTGKRRPGRPPKPEGDKHQQQQLRNKKYNLTDPGSGIVRMRTAFVQGYNIQTVASEDQIILAVSATGINADQGQLAPSVRAASEALERVGITEPIEQVLADSGYWNIRHVQQLQQQRMRVLLPPPVGNARSPEGLHPAARSMLAELETDDGKAAYRRRQTLIEPIFAHWKHIRGITRVLRRGQAAVQAEIDLIATTHNLLKLRTALQAA